MQTIRFFVAIASLSTPVIIIPGESPHNSPSISQRTVPNTMLAHIRTQSPLPRDKSDDDITHNCSERTKREPSPSPSVSQRSAEPSSQRSRPGSHRSAQPAPAPIILAPLPQNNDLRLQEEGRAVNAVHGHGIVAQQVQEEVRERCAWGKRALGTACALGTMAAGFCTFLYLEKNN